MKAILTAAFVLLALVPSPAQPAPVLRLRTAVPLPGVPGRLEQLAVDVARERLFVAALAADSVEVIDLNAGRSVQRLTGCSRPQGLLFLPKPNLLYVANGGSGTVKVYDGATFKALKTLGSLPEADNLLFDPQANRIYVGFGDGALGIINPLTGVHTATLRLLGHPESFAIESGGNRVFVNVPKAHHVAILNRLTQRLDEAWMLPQLEENHPMAYDETNRRLFVGCRKPARLGVLNTMDGNLVSEPTIAGDCHDLFHDARRRRIYATCGEGFISVIEQVNADTYRAREPVRTTPGARTGFFSPELDELFVAVPQTGGQPAEIRRYGLVD